MLKVEPDAMFVAENYEPLLRFDFLCKVIQHGGPHQTTAVPLRSISA